MSGEVVKLNSFIDPVEKDSRITGEVEASSFIGPLVGLVGDLVKVENKGSQITLEEL